MLDIAFGRKRDDLLSAGNRRRQAGALVSDAAEVRGEAVEVVLPPDFERVVVALGTFEPHAQEQLADHRRDLVRLTAVTKDDGRAVAEGATLGGEQFADELVVRLVLAEG